MLLEMAFGCGRVGYPACAFAVIAPFLWPVHFEPCGPCAVNELIGQLHPAVMGPSPSAQAASTICFRGHFRGTLEHYLSCARHVRHARDIFST